MMNAFQDKDYYSSLGVSRIATQDQIKTAYKQLALKWHPDRNHDPEAVEAFKVIVEAYEVLTNLEKKVQYDYYLAYRDQRIHLNQNSSRVSSTPASCTENINADYGRSAAHRRSFDLNDILASSYRTCYAQSVYRSQFQAPDHMYGTVRIHNRTQNMQGTVRFTRESTNGSDVKPKCSFDDLTNKG